MPNAVQAPRTRFWVFVAFIVLVALTGGGSRADISSLVVLRPACFLLAGYALLAARPGQLRTAGGPLWIVLALAAIMALQLVPLPPAMWQALPGRAAIAEVDALTGLAGIWRPLTLSTSGTWNSLFALIVPLTALLLVAILPLEKRPAILRALLAIVAASAVLGLVQAIGPRDGPLYFYRITNNGAPVGLFANRNHNAVMLAAAIPLLTYVGLHHLRQGHRALASLPLLGVLFVVPLVLVIGSRAGAVLALAGLAGSGLLAALLYLRPGPGKVRSGSAKLAIGGALLAITGVALASWWTARSEALDRLFSENIGEEFRLQVLPYLIELLERYFPFGSGFGTFEHVYYTIEPTELLRPTYLNHAHNDLLQLLIEGGLPAGLVLLAALAWLARCAWLLLQGRAGQGRTGQDDAGQGRMGPFACLSLALVLAGGLLDYPLRTPLMMVFAVLLCGCITGAHTAPAQDKRKETGH